VYALEWNGFEGWACESVSWRVVTVPQLGAKLVSLYDLRRGEEWLLQPLRPPVRLPQEGQSFTEYGLFGWDEMYPSIYACTYPAPGKYTGAGIPDHGEVWRLPWQVLEADKGGLTLMVQGQVLPYRLSRRLRWDKQAGEFTLDYALTNTGDEPLYGLWAAHPQFVVAAGDHVVLPPQVDRVLNARLQNGWGEIETAHTWPVTSNAAGTETHLDQAQGMVTGACRKFYVNPHNPVSRAGLSRPSAGGMLWMRWNPQCLPYLGIWVDEGCYSHQPVITLEPASAYIDSLSDAYRRGRVTPLMPGMTNTWEIRVELGEIMKNGPGG